MGDGPACIGLLGIIGSIYAAFVWKPDPQKIKGDGTQRTLNNRFLAVLFLSGPCAIAFWQPGDACTDCCGGDAGMAFILNFLIPHGGDCFACCCWTPKPEAFVRTPEMHGGRKAQAGDNVAGAGATPVAQAVAVAVATPVNG